MPNLHTIFEAQAAFQRHINSHPESMEDPEELIQYIKDMVLATEDELHEVLGEVGWKPWATSRHINREAMKSELVDTFQFFMNLCSAVGMSADELMFLHTEKLKKNYARANGNYDGVTTKCPSCKRALDDDNVSCEVNVLGSKLTGYCAQRASDVGDGFYMIGKDDK